MKRSRGNYKREGGGEGGNNGEKTEENKDARGAELLVGSIVGCVAESRLCNKRANGVTRIPGVHSSASLNTYRDNFSCLYDKSIIAEYTTVIDLSVNYCL